MKKQNCVGCEQNFYNGNNDLGVQECWSFKTAVLKLRRRVGMNDIPPWTATPRSLPSCYQQRGAIFVDPTVSS
jgi:hypothetical protein